MDSINLHVFACLRCGHEWVPRKHTYGHGSALPGNCPKCRSVYWDAPLNINTSGRSQHLRNKARGVD